MMVATAVVVSCLSAGAARAETLVTEFNGDRSALTREFEIEGPWLLDWHVGTDFPSAFGVEIDLVESTFLSHKGQVLKTKYAGAGTRLFYESGVFRFRVTASLAKWRLRVSKISDEEAAAMVPRQRRR